MGKGQELYQNAKKILPGGTQLLSKRPEMFLPDFWPAYYKKAKGCEIWDLDDNHYYDMSIMGIGACVLGYSNEQVNKTVIEAIKNGNSSTLNSYEEVELAQKLVELHPWASKVRFSRTGGESCAIAVRIARAYTGKDTVAICGYHGWHDWYLAANLGDSKNLDGQLLPGLEPAGVPRVLKGTAVTFGYGNTDQFDEIVEEKKDDLGVIIMEVERHTQIDLDFIHHIQKVAQHIGAVVIFDEISSGFRETIGGLHLKYKLEPDIAVLGKAMGNGHPIGAVIGKTDVMEAAQRSFISSTYWTERVGFVAGLETIKVFEDDKVIDQICKTGKKLTKGLEILFKKHNLNIDIIGLDSVLILAIKEPEPLLIKTIFTQEMLKAGFLASNVIYVSIAHTNEIIAKYLKAADKVLETISSAQKSKTLYDLLDGQICQSGFKRVA